MKKQKTAESKLKEISTDIESEQEEKLAELTAQIIVDITMKQLLPSTIEQKEL